MTSPALPCLLVMLSLAACVSAPIAAPTVSAIAVEPAANVAIGDRLDVIVYSAPELSRTVEVAPDGTIAIAYSGPVAAAGKTPAAIAEALSAALSGELRDPRVDVLKVVSPPPCSCDVPADAA